MNKFKVGDRVRCVSYANINMQVGMLFTVKAVVPTSYLQLEELMGGWHIERFELVEEPPKPVPHATPVAHVHAAQHSTVKRVSSNPLK